MRSVTAREREVEKGRLDEEKSRGSRVDGVGVQEVSTRGRERQTRGDPEETGRLTSP